MTRIPLFCRLLHRALHRALHLLQHLFFHRSLRHLLGLLLSLLLAISAPAWAIFKCDVNGKITYSDTPCSEGNHTLLRPTPKVDTDDAKQAQRTALREKNTLVQIEKAHAAIEAEQARQQQHQAKLAAERRRHCLALSQRVKWRKEDMAHIRAHSAEKAQRHYRRAADEYDADCSTAPRALRGLEK